jgi:hypothetical protein
MPSDLSGVRAALDATIKPVLPSDWKTVPNLAAPAAKMLVPVLYTEFTGISNQHNGTTLPPGLAFCDFDLCIAVASTDDRTGEDDVDAAVLALIIALDQSESVAWESAKKERLPTGQLMWRVSLAVITETN